MKNRLGNKSGKGDWRGGELIQKKTLGDGEMLIFAGRGLWGWGQRKNLRQEGLKRDLKKDK